MIPADHPFSFVAPFLEGKAGACHFSRYIYAPDSLFDQREHLRVESHLLSSSWLEGVIGGLRSEQELAFHSTFIARGRTWHIPMIDFSATPKIISDSIDRFRMYLPGHVFRSMAFFASGRSMHAYSLSLLSPKEWVDFNGRLLLANGRGGPALVDVRWIGHRLIGGFSALRWSWNTGHYLDAPHRVRLLV